MSKNLIKVVACLDRDTGNDPEAFGNDNHASTFINAYYLYCTILG